MPLNAQQLKSLEKADVSIGKIICVVKAAVKAYRCIKAAEGKPSEIAKCAATLVADIEKCLED